nr:GNAT family protein [Saccharomonospora viridis]
MHSRLCSLQWPTRDDYQLIETWLRPMSITSALTGDMNERVSAEEVRAANESGKIRYLMVVRKNGDRIGMVNYRAVGSAGSYSIGGAVGDPTRWNSGCGAEALWLLVDYLFHQLNAHRVEFTTASYNKHTMSILTKGGFVLEGVLRDFYYLDGMYYDRTIWSILREEFEEAAVTYANVYPVQNLVPDKDKQQAQEAFSAYLASDPPTSLNSFADRATRQRAY